MQQKQPFIVALACFALLLLGACGPSRAQTTLADVKASFSRPPPLPPKSIVDLAAIAVGRTLFSSPILSASGTMSCTTCHEPGGAWRDGRARSLDNQGLSLARHTPTLVNLAWASSLTSDGRIDTLEQQAVDPMVNGRMGALDLETIVARVETLVSADPALEVDYITAFAGREVTIPRISTAIAAFEASLVSPPAPFDHWIEGDPSAISPAAQRGFALFNGRGNCAACHQGWRFTDDGFHDIGMPDADLGRGAIYRDEPTLQHAFKTATLRDVGIRGPYMHDGSISSLDAVIDHYNGHYTHRASLDPDMRSPEFSRMESDDLRAFLETLSSAAPEVAPGCGRQGL